MVSSKDKVLVQTILNTGPHTSTWYGSYLADLNLALGSET